MTHLYGVIGDPIAHSLSPLIHKGWMRDHRLPADYLGLQVPPDAFDESILTLSKKGFKGLNVTMPHKLNALKWAKIVTPQARKIGAVNTLWRDLDGDWHGDNTDAPGFMASLGEIFNQPLEGTEVLVLGAGGSARAIIYALDEAGARVRLANRTLSKAEAILSLFEENSHTALSLEEGLAAAGDFRLVVNTTSLGYSGQGLKLPDSHGGLLYDISYGKAAKTILEPAAAQGWRAADGLSMLVYQAAYAFERWFDIMPDIEKGLQRCRRVLEFA